LTIKGTPYGSSGDQRSAPKLTAFVREGEPVIWEEDYSITVKYDYIVESESKGTWTFTNLKPGTRYYIHFINKGPAGLLYTPTARASWTSEKECGAPEEEESDDDVISDDDSETAPDDDNIYSDDEPKKESKSSGCSMTVF
jgi:hypothetical protein